MQSTKHLLTVKPIMRHAVATATTAVNEILMDWYPFQVPRGGCRIKSLHATIAGTNGDATSQENQLDLTLLFAKNINGKVPPSLGASNTVPAAVNMSKIRPHMVGQKYLEVDNMDKVTGSLFNDDLFQSYRMIDINAKDADFDEIAIFMEGDNNPYERSSILFSSVPGMETTLPGYQTMWMAVVSMEAGHDFGTGITLNMPGSANTLVSVIENKIITTGTDARLCFAIGDVVGDASAAALPMGIVTAVTATSITLDRMNSVVAHGTEIVNMAPITWNFGIEY